MTKAEIIELIKEDEAKIKTEMTRLTALALLIRDVEGIDEEDKQECIADVNEAYGDLNSALKSIEFARKDIER